MAGPWKAWKTKDGFPTLSTVPWKSRRKREISTFPPPGFTAMEKWKTKKPVSHFPTAARDDDSCSLSENQKPKKGSRPLRGLLISYPFSLRSNEADFMLIFRLENALAPAVAK